MPPLPCQRALFNLPDDVAYLDAAAWAPIPHPVQAAGQAGIARKASPWTHDHDDDPASTEHARAAAAHLIGATPDDIAIVSSVSHAMATAAANLRLPPGARILRIADEYPSQRHAWDHLAATQGLTVEEVPRPQNADWTAALLAAIARPGAPPLALATLTPLHWSDGAVIDLARLAPAIHAAGAAFVVDATQAVGATPIDVAALRPDFLAFPTYKWTLGPYGLAFLYAAPHRQTGRPLEPNSGNHPQGARRYDKGELHDPVTPPMAAAGLDLVAAWTPAAIAARLRHLTDALAEGAAQMGLPVLPRELRSPHILGLHLPGGMPPTLIAHLRAARVFASNRLGALRLSPHVWTNDADIDRTLRALHTALR